MQQSSLLFDLIQSLTVSEKRYVKVFTARYKGDKNYLRLFDAINKQEVYDEAALLKKFRKEKFTRQINYTKNYLYNLILKSLQAYHDKSIETQLSDYSQQVEILYHKGLYEQSLKMLNRAKKLASETSNYLTVLKLLEWEEVIVRTETFKENLDKHIQDVLHEKQESLTKQEALQHCADVRTKFYSLYNKMGPPRNEEQLKDYETFVKSASEVEKDGEMPWKACILLYDIKATFSGFKNDFQQRFDYQQRAVKIYEKEDIRIASSPNSYIALLNNYLGSCLLSGDHDVFVKTLDRMRTFIDDIPYLSKSETLRTLIFQWSTNRELDYYTFTNDYEGGSKIISEIEMGWIYAAFIWG